MLLKIFSLNKIEYEADVVGLNVRTADGDVTVLDNHRPLVGVLKPCTAEILTKDNKKIPFDVKSGFLEVDGNNHLNLLVD